MEIKITDPIEQPKACYRLVLEFMHGDGDGDSEREHFYDEDDMEHLKTILCFINDIDKSQNPDEYHGICNKYTDKKLLDELRQMLIDDAGSQGYPAYLEYFTLTYYDAYGVEFKTELVFS